MQLIKSKRYNLGDIISYVIRKRNRNIVIKKTLPFKRNTILVVGGGFSVKKNLNYIKEFLKQNPNVYIIYAGSRNFDLFDDIKNQSILCITGNEINKIKKKNLVTQNFLVNDIVDNRTILPKNLKKIFRLKKNNSLVADSSAKINICWTQTVQRRFKVSYRLRRGLSILSGR